MMREAQSANYSNCWVIIKSGILSAIPRRFLDKFQAEVIFVNEQTL